MRMGGNPYGLVDAKNHLRCVKFGRLAAQYKRRQGEEIVPLIIKRKPKKARKQ